MVRKVLLFFALGWLMVGTSGAQTPMQVFGVWHCYSDGCNWFSVPNMTTFDTDNHWLIDRGDGVPAVNVVVLSFVNPVDLMNSANSSNTVNGIPIGIELPPSVVLQITESEPGIKGDTASGATKPAKLSTGAVVNVPLFVKEGEWVKVDTRTGEYLERVNR